MVEVGEDTEAAVRFRLDLPDRADSVMRVLGVFVVAGASFRDLELAASPGGARLGLIVEGLPPDGAAHVALKLAGLFGVRVHGRSRP